MNPVLAPVQILDMQLDYVTNGVIEHKKARSLLNSISRFSHVHQVEDRSQDLVHALHVLYFRV